MMIWLFLTFLMLLGARAVILPQGEQVDLVEHIWNKHGRRRNLSTNWDLVDVILFIYVHIWNKHGALIFAELKEVDGEIDRVLVAATLWGRRMKLTVNTTKHNRTEAIKFTSNLVYGHTWPPCQMTCNISDVSC